MKSVLLILLFLGQSVLAGTYLKVGDDNDQFLLKHHCSKVLHSASLDTNHVFELVETEETKIDDPTEIVAHFTFEEPALVSDGAFDLFQFHRTSAHLTQLAPRAPPFC